MTTEEIAAWIKAHPERVQKLPNPTPTEAPPSVAEQFDRVQVGNVFGTYQRRKHRGSDDQ